MTVENEPTRCGYIAIVGRPNAGKSTLLNRIIGQKISIVSEKPQTTRHAVLGVKTLGAAQAIYVDTPGLHRGAKRRLNTYMNRVAAGALEDVDVVMVVTEALRWTAEDEFVLQRLKSVKAPLVLVLNKIDTLPDRRVLLPYIAQVAARAEFAQIIPVSAARGENVDRLEREIHRLLPVSPKLFPDEQVTDRDDRFLAAELIREQLMRRFHQEVPYSLAVQIERFEQEHGVLHVEAVIWVERKSQKPLVIGKGGEALKQVGTLAREAMSLRFGKKVVLKTWVRVKEHWPDDERSLSGLGHE